MKYYPLSDSQTAMYYEWEKDKSLTQYNISFVYDFPATIDPSRLINAFKAVLESHPAIKLRIKLIGEELVQFFREEDPVEISLTKVSETEFPPIVEKFIRPFDLLASPLYRFELYQTEKQLYALVDFHHINFDGLSSAIFNRDLALAYEGIKLAGENITGCEFAELEQSRKGDAEYIDQEAYYEKKLSGVSMTRLPSLNNQESEVGYMQLTSEFIGQGPVNDFCTKYKISPNNLFAAALGICLNRFTREQDIAFCTAHHGRLDEKLSNSIGMYVKTLPVVMNISPDLTVIDLLNAIRSDMKVLWTRQAFPFSDMSEKFGASMEIMYTYQKGFAEYFDMEGQRAYNRFIRSVRTTDKLIIYIFQTPGDYEIKVEYNDSLYDLEYIQSFAFALKNTVLTILAGENARCADVSVLSQDQETEVLKVSTGRVVDHDRSLSLIDLFRSQVCKTPDNIAVVFQDRRLTYKELDRITDRLAKKLRASGVEKETVVGVMIDRSEYMVIYPLAVMKAGGAYMPLDYTLPSDRLSFMVQDAGARHILSEGSRVSEGLPDFTGMVMNREEIPLMEIDEKIILPQPVPEDMFVLLYTSGSTGTPKGCILEHRNIVNFCNWWVNETAITAKDKGTAYANFGFDAHMIDIYPMITAGASVYILPSDMRMDLLRINRYMEENGLTIAFMTTQIGRQFAEDIENHSLRLLSVGGERLLPTKKPPYLFYNIYGPTECTICSTFYTIDRDYDSPVIGHSLTNVSNYILDQNQQLLPLGVAGELCIGGEAVGRGYLNRDDLNREKFVDWRGMKLYRSGDLARYNHEGEIEYIGRLDNQVKLRGLRIELGEIESVMCACEGVTSAVVDVKEIGGVQHLCGYFTAKTPVDPEMLKDHLRTRLAEFMVPDTMTHMERLPFNNNGKVNRKLLPVPRVEVEQYTAPQTLTEQILFDVIAEMLGNKYFGINTNLFSLGLTSILAIKFSVTLQKKHGITIQTKDILKLRTIEHLAEIATKTETETSGGRDTLADKRDYYLLSENQMGLYYDWEKNREALQYNIAACLRFSDQVDVERLKDSISAVMEAHPYLKTTLDMKGSQIVQVRRDKMPVEITVLKTDEGQMQENLTWFVRPFNLFGDTLYRFVIYQTESHAYFLFDIHHIIFDGISMNIFLNDLKEAFEGRLVQPEGFTAFDHALEEDLLIRSEKFREAEAYFDQLIGKSVLTVFPSVSQGNGEGKAASFNRTIPKGMIPEFCRQNSITENNFFLSVLCLIISRYTRENQIAVTTVSSGRADNRLSNLMGMFVRTLPVVAEFKNQSWIDFVRGLQEQVFETMEREIYPFTKMAEKYGLKPEINFAYEGGVDTDLHLGTELASLDFLNLDTVKFPFSVMIFPEAEGYDVKFEFDQSLYTRPEVDLFATLFTETSDQLSAGPDRPVPEICLVIGALQDKVIKVSAGQIVQIDPVLTLPDLFKEQVRKSPDNTAVVFQEVTLTYRELDQLTDRIAKKLHSSGVQRDAVVGVLIDRSEWMVIYPLAVMKAGGAYMPLDISMPSDRLSFMVQDAGAKHILSEGSRVHDLLPDFEGMVIKTEDMPSIQVDSGMVLPKIKPEDMFVLLYTSGSTGTPKGCMLEHRNIVNFCRWWVGETAITHKDKGTAYANFAFDAHMIDIYPMITTGASVYILPSNMRMDLLRINRYMEENGLTVAFMTTQIGRQFAEDIENHSLRLLSVGGERLMPTKKPAYLFYNLYGPTECTICSTFYNIDRDYNSPVIGHSLANVSNYILDQNQQLLPLGMAGELCIGGAGVGRGYLNRDELTREKFVDWRGMKLYRTGDLARYNDAGEIEYISRLDNQVKLRGLRIELGEIENAMLGFEGISTAVVDVKEISGVQHLCGYYVANKQVDTEELRQYLRTRLTEFMLPTVITQLEKFPLTNNGKVNRKALPVPELVRSEAYVAPMNKIEEDICQVYSGILKIGKVGILDSFFKIGGSSITAIKAIIQILNLGYNIKYGDLFKLKTPQAVAKFLSDQATGGFSQEVEEMEDISDYDYSAIDELLNRETPDLWENYREYELGNVLLTGATGYLGIHVLRELIAKEKGKIYCLIRSKGSLTPETRLKTQLMYYFSDTFEEIFDTRIIPVDGDITSMESLRSLTGHDINTVINCAANVKHYAAGNELDRINVEGVANLIELCRAEGARLIHVSTRSTFGLIEKHKLAGGTMMNENKLFIGQKIDNGYVLSKFKAERIILQAVAGGLDAKIMRVGNLMGRDSDGEFQINFRSNAFVNTLKSYKVLKMFPLSQLISPLEVSPIDCTAAAVVSLSNTPREIIILHTYNNYRLNMANLIYAMQQYGFEMTLVSDRCFNEEFQKVMQDTRKSELVSGLLHYRLGEDLVEVPGENDYTTTLLYKQGIRWPLANDDYSTRLIGILDGMGFFDEN
ncbi:MAG: amino acid adenylation domain-containing protein [Bacteroidales bacterium]|jgi:gramicidin S synthase 2